MDRFEIEGFEMMVPTYNGKWLDGTNGAPVDFDDPQVPVLVCPADGVRIVLGSHDYHDMSKPDVQIERRHNGWMIFLHPLGGSDPSGCVVFLDDGRSYVSTEHGYGPTAPIALVEYEEAIAELDNIKPSGLSSHDMPPNPPDPTTQFPRSPALIDAFKSAQEALAGDSNDDEHDALLALVEALNECDLVEYQTYSPGVLIEDFTGWAGLDRSERPDQEDIETYVSVARPADSCPLEVKRVLCEWAEEISTTPADPCAYVLKTERNEPH